MKLAPHEHAQTVELPQPQFINKVVDDRAETSPSPGGDEKKQSRSLKFNSETKWWIPFVQQKTDNRKQMPFQRVQKKSEVLSTRPPELGTSNVFSTRSERSSFTPRSSRQGRCKRKPNTANVKTSCRSEGDQQSTGPVEAEGRKRSTSMSPTVSELRTSQRPRKPKKRKTSADQKLI